MADNEPRSLPPDSLEKVGELISLTDVDTRIAGALLDVLNLGSPDGVTTWKVQFGITAVFYGAGGDATINFPVAFAVACDAVVAVDSSKPNPPDPSQSVTQITKNGFHIGSFNGPFNANRTVTWIAIGH